MISKMEANSVIVKHRRDSTDPPEAAVGGMRYQERRSDGKPMIPKLTSMRVDPRRGSTKGRSASPNSHKTTNAAVQVGDLEGPRVILTSSPSSQFRWYYTHTKINSRVVADR